MTKESPPVRGRPKTLNRDHVLQTALMQYWDKGPTDVAIGEICRLTGASKPGVYREFGSDDGLKLAALEVYRTLALEPLFEILQQDQSFGDAQTAIIVFTTQDRETLGVPNGCLHVTMRAQSDKLGITTRVKVDKLRQDILANYAAWIDRAKSKGEFSMNIPTDVAALFYDAQNGGAMRMQREGVPNAVIAKVLRLSFQGIQ
ncbi:MAG: AcrR family transcriptional regulator [Reinekea sp.]|jgi:AcrR family transcriptional regulator